MLAILWCSPWYKSAFDHIKGHAHGELLEVGCGLGEFALWLARTMPALRVTAVDFLESAIAIAKSNAAEINGSVQFMQDDAQAFGFPPNSF